jgi:hypothetical protein
VKPLPAIKAIAGLRQRGGGGAALAACMVAATRPAAKPRLVDLEHFVERGGAGRRGLGELVAVGDVSDPNGT